MKAIFITGTDTHIGKTFFSCLLLQALAAHGLKTFGIKPVASGCEKSKSGELHNADALSLQAAASVKRPYHLVNPIALAAPIAPHIAAAKMGISLSKRQVKDALLTALQSEADIHIIEGVGGWAVPLNDHELFSEVICALGIPVILTVGIKLGCLNHALLTHRSIQAMQVPYIGWVANCLSPDTGAIADNILTLQRWIDRPCLGTLPYCCKSLDALNIAKLLENLQELSYTPFA